MKIKDGYMLHEVAGTKVVVPVGARTVDFNGIITLNETACFLWNLLADGADENSLLEALLKEYDVPKDVAAKDIAAFINKLKEADILE